MKHIGAIAAAFALCAAPALAQETAPLPRFDALEQQTQMLEQRQLDKLETQRQQEATRPITPNSSVTQADKALRSLEIERQMNQLRLQSDERRAQVQRERDIANNSLPNRRIASHSSLVIHDPERYALPRAPKGQYYARLEGRFVLVDSTSELVVKVLDAQPGDPTADVPLGAPPPLQPPLPATPIAPGSSFAIPQPSRLALPPAPPGQFYARYAGRIYLVDSDTHRAVKAVAN